MKYVSCVISTIYHTLQADQFCYYDVEYKGMDKETGLVKLGGLDNEFSKSVTAHYFDGLNQDCSTSIANALELQQPCTKPSI